MDIRVKEDAVAKVISNDVLTTEQIWSILLEMLPEKDLIFASFSTSLGHYVWALPGDDWMPISDADEATSTLARDILNKKRKAVGRSLASWPPDRLEALFTIPSDAFFFYRYGTDGQLQIKLAAWDYRSLGPLEDKDVKLAEPAPEKLQDITLKFIEAEHPVPGYGLQLKLADGRFTGKLTDEDGCFPMPGLEIGRRFTILSADGSRDFSFTVEDGKTLIVYDLTGDVTVQVTVTRDDVPASGLSVLIDYGGNTNTALTGDDGIARKKVPYRKDAFVTAGVEGKDETVPVVYPLTSIRINLVTQMATVIVEYFHGDAPVDGQRVLVRVKGMEDIILHTDSGGRTTCRVPFHEKSYVVAHSGRFVDKKNLRWETLFHFEEPVIVVSPLPKPESEPKPEIKPEPKQEPRKRKHRTKVDEWGNPEGDENDLVKDGEMKGYRVILLILNIREFTPIYTQPALAKKGFDVFVLEGIWWEPSKLEELLNGENTQLWVLAESTCLLDDYRLRIIYDFYNRGGSLFLLSDNEPYFADTNVILDRLFHSKMSGNYNADQVISVQEEEGMPGIIKSHPIATGIRNFYEGITISHVEITPDLKPLVYSSDGLVVTAYYDQDGRRALVDGGYTRLFCNWNSAGTERFVVNCAGWLAGVD